MESVVTQKGNRPHSVSRRARCLQPSWGDVLVPQPAEDDGYDLVAICLGEHADCSDQGTIYVPGLGQDVLGGIQIVPDNGGEAFALHLAVGMRTFANIFRENGCDFRMPHMLTT